MNWTTGASFAGDLKSPEESEFYSLSLNLLQVLMPASASIVVRFWAISRVL